MEQDFLTVAEFAQLMRLSYHTITRSIKKGRINAFRVGIGKKSPFRIPRSEIYRIATSDLEVLIVKEVEKRMKEK